MLQQGIQTARMPSTKMDSDSNKLDLRDISKKIKLLRPTGYYEIDKGTVFEGTKTYRLKNMVVNRGNGKVTVSPMFKKVCMWGESKPNWLPRHVEKKIEDGPRLASVGYRMGGKPQYFTRW